MVVGRLKSEVSKLRDKNYGERALNGLQTVSEELNNLRGDINKGEKLTEEVEQTGNEKELEEDLQQQRNIFEEFEHVEGDLKKILTLEQEEINELHTGIEQTINEEKEIEATILALAEEIEKIEQLASQTEETLTNGEVKFNTNCVEQAIEYGTERIFEIYDNAEEASTASMMVSIEKILRENNQNQIGSRKENFSRLNLQEELQKNQGLVLELALSFNELLYELGQDCVDKNRYVQMEEELGELKQLIEEIKQVAEQLVQMIDEEKEIIEFEQVEEKHLPQTVEGLKELGQELQIMGQALEEEKATEREVLAVTQKLKSNPREIQQKSQNEIEKLERNMQKLERMGHELEAEAERLESEQQQVGQLNQKEEQQLENLIEKGQNVEKHLKTASNKILHSKKIALGPNDDDAERDEFRDSANRKLEMRLSIGLDQAKSVIGSVLREAEKLREMTEKEEQIELEISKKDLEIETPI